MKKIWGSIILIVCGLVPAGGFPAAPYPFVAGFEIANDAMGPPLYDNVTPALASMEDAGFLVVWRYDYSLENLREEGIKAELVGPAGDIVADVDVRECLAGCSYPGMPDVAPIGPSAVAVWECGSGLGGAWVSSTGEMECLDLSALGEPGIGLDHPKIAPAGTGYRLAWIEVGGPWTYAVYTARLDENGSPLSVPGVFVAPAGPSGYAGIQEDPMDLCRYGDGHVVASDNHSILELRYIDGDDHVSPEASWTAGSIGIAGISIEAKSDLVGVAAVGFSTNEYAPKPLATAATFRVASGVPVFIQTAVLEEDDEENNVGRPGAAGLLGGQLAVLWATGPSWDNGLRLTTIGDDGTIDNVSGWALTHGYACSHSDFPSLASGPEGSLVVWEGVCGTYSALDEVELFREEYRAVHSVSIDPSGTSVSERHLLSREPIPIFYLRGAYEVQGNKYMLASQWYDEIPDPYGRYKILNALSSVDPAGVLSGPMAAASPCNEWDFDYPSPQPLSLEPRSVLLANPSTLDAHAASLRSGLLQRDILMLDAPETGPCDILYFPRDDGKEITRYAAASNGRSGMVVLSSMDSGAYAWRSPTDLEVVSIGSSEVTSLQGSVIATEEGGVASTAVAPSLDGSEFFVAWAGRSGEAPDVLYTLKGYVAGEDGQAVTDAFPISEHQAGDDPLKPEVSVAASGNGQFTVLAAIYSVDESTGSQAQGLYACVVSRTGEVLHATASPLYQQGGTLQLDPVLIHDGSEDTN